MTPLFLARLCAFWTVMNAVPETSPTAGPWRIVSTRAAHVALWPAGANEGAGLTLRVTLDW